MTQTLFRTIPYLEVHFFVFGRRSTFIVTVSAVHLPACVCNGLTAVSLPNFLRIAGERRDYQQSRARDAADPVLRPDLLRPGGGEGEGEAELLISIRDIPWFALRVCTTLSCGVCSLRVWLGRPVECCCSIEASARISRSRWSGTA